jgi:putative tryptophan/tyrosine transport system substrate-binding protein
MKRRQFIALVGGAAAWPLAARGQIMRKRPLIGRLSTSSKDVPPVSKYIGQFLTGMKELGYVEGRDFDVTYAMADFHADRLPRVTAELVKLAPDVIVAGATLEAVAASKATSTIPIVVAALADPVALGFAASDARPTGNVTGITPYVKGLPAKQLELARELVPGATRIGLMDDVTDPKAHPQRQEIETAGRTLEIEVVPAEVRTAADIDAAYQALASAGIQAVVVEQSSRGVEEAAHGLRLSRARRRGRLDQLRCRSHVVCSQDGVLRRSDTQRREALRLADRVSDQH